MGDIANWLVDAFSKLADGVVWLLPPSPFAALELAFDGEILRYVNYFVPVKEALDILVAWGTTIAGWYLYQIIMRWAKAIR
jgi:hypothetical protein